MSLLKPQLRGHVGKSLKSSFLISLVLAVASAVAWKYVVINPREKKYADFYKTFDSKADYERMKRLGRFENIPPEGFR